MQDSYLFSDTIARNIAISEDEIDLDKLRYAAHIANIADYIEALPWDTILKLVSMGRESVRDKGNVS